LEIGSALGGFAHHAATRYGCNVDVTYADGNRAQPSCRRVTADDVNGRMRLIQTDYRQLKGRYNKVVAIENISSMGRPIRDSFFKECNRLLKDDGVMGLQTVLRTETSSRWFSGETDIAGPFMQPSGCFPSLSDLSRSIETNTDLRLIHLEDITPHYAVTTKRWREQLYANVDRVRDKGISEHILRRWAFGLCFEEAAFAERHFGCAQMIFAKSHSRHHPILPPLASKFGVILQKRKNEIENWIS
jgi:cyclopropane-fatty-acyl-phospholipid synthase